jgi:hypothetical protein
MIACEVPDPGGGTMLVLWLVACGSSEFGVRPIEPDAGYVAVPVTSGAATSASELVDPAVPDHVVHREVFDAGADTRSPVADFLFVLDDSSSMDTIVDRVNQAFVALSEADAFPAHSRIAVMSTLPGNDADLSQVSRAVDGYVGIGEEPGFLSLVDREGIERYRAHRRKGSARFALDGCDAWFAPSDTNAAGFPCLVAHTQVAGRGVLVEAGLTAFDQMLWKQAGTPIFRDGAAVNVIFVSDTQDPGVAPSNKSWPRAKGLVRERPTYADLRDDVAIDNVVASFRIHAIAPARSCTAEDWTGLGTPYQDAARESGGQILDICTADDYAPLIRAIAEDGGRVTEPVFALDRRADAVRSVTVDGTPVPWHVARGGRAVSLDDGAIGDGKHRVVVEYQAGR